MQDYAVALIVWGGIGPYIDATDSLGESFKSRYQFSGVINPLALIR